MEADESFRGTRADCPACGTSFIVPSLALEPGVELDGFKLVRRLGAGGMGEVWLAKQSSLDRFIALKILSPKVASDQEFVSRFEQEVKMVGKLSHPNIITAYQAGFSKGVRYLAMEYVDGAELSSRMKVDRVIPEADALRIIRKVSEALAYAWSKHKVLHRDIKPENIMLTAEGEPEIMDLGISKSMTEDNSLTMTGVVMGTPYYMSPEQARAEKILDCRSDIYSLGATLFHMVTGSVPYEGTTAFSIIAKHLSTDPSPSPRAINKSLSPQCAALIKVMMSKDRERRQDSWEAVVRDVDRVLAGEYPEAGDVKTTNIPRQRPPNEEIEEEPQPKSRWKLLGPALTWASRIALYSILALLAYVLWNAGVQKDVKPGAKQPAETASASERGHKDPPPMRQEQEPNLEIKSIAETPGPKPSEPPVAPAPPAQPVQAPQPEQKPQAEPAPAQEPEKPKIKKGQSEFDECANEALRCLFKGKLGAAVKALKDASESPDLQAFAGKLSAMKEIVKELKGSEMAFVDALRASEGKMKTLEVNGMKTSYHVNRIESGPGGEPLVFLGDGNGRRFFLRVSDLGIGDRLPFIDSDEAAHVVKGIDMVRRNDLDMAAKEFAQAGALAEPLAKALRDSEMVEEIKAPFKPQGRLLLQFERARQEEEAKAEEPKPKPKDPKAYFKGSIVNFNPATLDIAMRYDFKSQEQLEDWQKAKALGEGSAFIENGHMTIDASTAILFLELRARFDSVTATSTCSFKGNGIFQGFAGVQQGGGALFIGGMNLGGDRRFDASIRGRMDDAVSMMDPRKGPTKISSLKPDSRINAELSFKAGKATFKANASTWPEQSLTAPPEGLGLTIGALRSRNEYDEIVVKGRLNRTWYESTFAGKSQ